MLIGMICFIEILIYESVLTGIASAQSRNGNNKLYFYLMLELLKMRTIQINFSCKITK